MLSYIAHSSLASTELLRIPTIQKTCTVTLLGFLGCSLVASFLPIYASEQVVMPTFSVA